MSNRNTIFSDLKSKFIAWLTARGANGVFAAADHYANNLEAIGLPIASHTAIGAKWDGLYELLTGDRPIGVYQVRSLAEFSRNYGKAVSFFSVETRAKEDVRGLYPSCTVFDQLFDYAHSTSKSGNGDGGHTRSAFNKYTAFLCELETQVMNMPTSIVLKEPWQRIYYGAPGTGKSYDVNDKIKQYGIADDQVFRTTFHPDSDYSTFVGAYKPMMESVIQKKANQHLTIEQLVEILKKEYDTAVEGSEKGKALAVHLFAEEYFQYLDGEYGHVKLADLIEKSGIPKVYNAGLRDSINVAKYHALRRGSEKRIAYAFRPQAFMNAYVKAWEDISKPVVLVIEEINRGNCAQIFGDLFQLLDRGDDGYSKYPITADADIASWLEGKIPDATTLRLPPNLYIWATMNTSDQSLFPIDSAFKRRWDWNYVPIAKPDKSDDSNWKERKIKVGSSLYDWWDFLTIINKHIAKATESEDKQLGYFFVKAPDDTGYITADQFANKVLFYLYGDVFKSYDLPAAAFKREGGAAWTFRDFFYSETVVVQKADGQIVKDSEGNAVKTVSDGTTQMLKRPGDVNEFELASFLDHLKWKDEVVGKTSIGAGADV